MDYREIYEIPSELYYQIFRNCFNQPVGAYYYDPYSGINIYSSRRTEDHFYVKKQGFGIDTKILKQLEQNTRIRIIYEGRDRIIRYFSNLGDWFTHGEDVNYGEYGPQIILPTKHMWTEDEPPKCERLNKLNV